jgi:hypothetical protein
MTCKTLLRQLNIEQHEPILNLEVNSCALDIYSS